ncbi:MAG TPA: hypothetical protein VFZ53_28975 [Polyangiaceae bacterium]
MTTNLRLPVVALGFLLVGCGGDGDGGGDASKPICSIGVTLAGDVEARFDVDDDVSCLIAHSSGSGIELSYIPAEEVSTIELDIAEVTEGETGADFPMTVVVNLDAGTRYTTGACTATLTEHRLDGTETTSIGELRNYVVVGTGSCAEPALPPAPATGSIELGALSFRIPATWRD